MLLLYRKQKRKKLREKRRAAKEANMKQDKRELELQVKEEALQHMLTSHLQLLCSLDMISEVGDNTTFTYIFF